MFTQDQIDNATDHFRDQLKNLSYAEQKAYVDGYMKHMKLIGNIFISVSRTDFVDQVEVVEQLNCLILAKIVPGLCDGEFN